MYTSHLKRQEKRRHCEKCAENYAFPQNGPGPKLKWLANYRLWVYKFEEKNFGGSQHLPATTLRRERASQNPNLLFLAQANLQSVIYVKFINHLSHKCSISSGVDHLPTRQQSAPLTIGSRLYFCIRSIKFLEPS